MLDIHKHLLTIVNKTPIANKVQYMDESGFTLVDAGKTYGHSEKGKLCYEQKRSTGEVR